MCTVSMIGDHYTDRFKRRDYWPLIEHWPTQQPAISREEFDALRKEVQEMKDLLRRAKKYDEDNGEPNCEIDEKMELLRKMAEFVGIKLDDVLSPGNQQKG